VNKNNFIFVAGNQPKMTIDSSGYVGIGTTSPSVKFEFPKEKEPLTEWYKAGVKARGLTPHTKDKINGSET
jgi:hypothetical protein